MRGGVERDSGGFIIYKSYYYFLNTLFMSFHPNGENPNLV